MSKQRMVNTRFWSDPWIVDELNPLDRYLFLYLLTNEKTNVAGAYELSLRTMSNETGIEKEELLRMMKRLESRIVYVDGWVILRKAIAHQNYRSPKIQAGIADTLKSLPKQLLQYLSLPDNFGDLLKSEYGIDTVSVPYGSGIAFNLIKSNIIKSNITKLNSEKPNLEKTPSKDIDAMFDKWEEIVGFPLQGNKDRNRKACSNLLKTQGKERLVQLLKGVAMSHQDRYAPRISDFAQLQSKMNDLIVWGKKKGVTNAVAQF